MRGSRLIPFVVAFLLLFISTVHACPDQDFLMAQSSFSASMGASEMEPGPCSKPKQDTCKSIRDQMLSIRPSSPIADVILNVTALLQSAHFQIPSTADLYPIVATPGIVSDPFYRPFLVFSHQVLRI